MFDGKKPSKKHDWCETNKSDLEESISSKVVRIVMMCQISRTTLIAREKAQNR